MLYFTLTEWQRNITSPHEPKARVVFQIQLPTTAKYENSTNPVLDETLKWLRGFTLESTGIYYVNIPA